MAHLQDGIRPDLSACEPISNRPIVGNANLCLNDIHKECPNDGCKGLLSTIKHEIAHALAFSDSLFGYFRDKVSYNNSIEYFLASVGFGSTEC